MRRALATLTLIVTACGRSDAPESLAINKSPASIEAATFAPDLAIDLSQWQKAASGLYWRDVAIGTGRVVQRGQTISVYYDGRLPDGTQFDATTLGNPADFAIGVGRVIPGWDEGVPGMKVGGKRQLIVPPALGYGARANGPIPANATLVFTIEVLAIH
jgi:FKBP-type peptidyl-prolyl cis-trans isomerase